MCSRELLVIHYDIPSLTHVSNLGTIAFTHRYRLYPFDVFGYGIIALFTNPLGYYINARVHLMNNATLSLPCIERYHYIYAFATFDVIKGCQRIGHSFSTTLLRFFFCGVTYCYCYWHVINCRGKNNIKSFN